MKTNHHVLFIGQIITTRIRSLSKGYCPYNIKKKKAVDLCKDSICDLCKMLAQFDSKVTCHIK